MVVYVKGRAVLHCGFKNMNVLWWEVEEMGSGVKMVGVGGEHTGGGGIMVKNNVSVIILMPKADWQDELFNFVL